MTTSQIILLVFILIGLIMGLVRGLIDQLFSIAAVVVGYIVAASMGDAAMCWLVAEMGWAAIVCKVVAYTVLFIGTALVVELIGALVTKITKKLKLGIINRILGGVFGVIKWLIVAYFIDSQFGTHLIP